MSDLRISGASTSPRSESDIRVNFGDPSKIIAASNDINNPTQAQFFSINGGVTWGQTNLPPMPGDAFQSDPAVDWTSDGTAWALTIGIDSSQINLLGRCFKSTDFGANWTPDASFAGTQTGVDREIMWVDHSPTSPYKDQIYATWHVGIPVFVARRTAGASGAWQPPIQVSGAETTVKGIGGDIKTNSVGDVFVFWPDADGSRNILVAKSTNGGAFFGAPVIIATTFATSRRLSIPAAPYVYLVSRGARVYVSAGAYRTATKDVVHAVWTDLSGDPGCTSGSGPGASVSSTCKTRVWYSRSTNGGAAGSWSTPVKLNNQASLNDQFHAKLCVDESNGNLLVTYHDTVSDPGRLKTEVWMQTSTDDGQTWSPAVKVTSAQTNETSASANVGNQYGDYNGLSGFAGNYFPSWTDRRSGAAEEIWTSQLSLIEKQCYFTVDKSTFGQDEVQAMLQAGAPTVDAAFHVVVEGFSAGNLSIEPSDLNGAPTHKPTFSHSPPFAGLVFGEPTALLAEDSSLPATPQRFTWVYPISFTDASGFTQPETTVALNASYTSLSGVTVSNSAELKLLQQPDPYETDGPTSWLSTDLRVFHIKQGESKFGAPVMGNAPADAIAFIQQALTNLNPGGNSAGQSFENDLDPNATEVALNQYDASGTKAIFNFAIAKVRYRAIAQDAQAVRVFFRLCPALTVSTAYDPSTTYRTYSDGVQYGHKIALLGTQNNNILTIPCFATTRGAPSANMDAQLDMPNVQQTIAHNTTGAEIVRYFGCWLDINQPDDKWFPLNPSSDGPFGGTLKSVLELVRNQHQCLIAEIAFDPDPIPTTPAPVTPGTSDKLAQRNLTLVPSANPGDVASRRVPNTFELKPTPAQSTLGPDELMIAWGNTPAGTVARIYLPTVSADELLELAAKRYSAAKLSRVDEHTIECQVDQVTYLPIPPGPSLNHTGLLTIDLPPGVQKGQEFHAIVRQVTSHSAQKMVAFVAEALVEGQAAHETDVRHETGVTPAPPASPASPASPAAQTTQTTDLGAWKRVLGTFQVSIPVQTKQVMLAPEERLYSILRWILASLPPHDRWYPVFHRYVGEIALRVQGLGGNPALIPPSPTGQWAGTRSVLCRALAGVSGALLAALVMVLGVLSGTVLALAGAIVAFLLVVVALVWITRCHPGGCLLLRTGIAGLGLGAAGLAVAVLLSLSTPQLMMALAISVVLAVIGGIIGRLAHCY